MKATPTSMMRLVPSANMIRMPTGVAVMEHGMVITMPRLAAKGHGLAVKVRG